ncbi:hypothetical protein [Mycoplasma suis]|uniref:Uncharacterized protein n=1 Tax=Mycoplasma suis (strain Illinois) TaxID=768700 RepID=F0QRN1_MYCSL|nr:hypothetical protein [Mycoplasma suis]ADX98151.1 hypothetical protein MSU_0619 [Mycoplasma suis str. Illinois]
MNYLALSSIVISSIAGLAGTGYVARNFLLDRGQSNGNLGQEESNFKEINGQKIKVLHDENISWEFVLSYGKDKKNKLCHWFDKQKGKNGQGCFADWTSSKSDQEESYKLLIKGEKGIIDKELKDSTSHLNRIFSDLTRDNWPTQLPSVSTLNNWGCEISKIDNNPKIEIKCQDF